MTEPQCSVVISCQNRHQLLFECFRGLAEQTLGRDRFEVVLIDNQSSEPLDTVADRARRELGLNISCIRTTEDRGPAPARNLGASLATAPILAFTDSDCRPHPDWLAAALAAFADPAVALVTGPAHPKPGQPVKLTSKMHFTYSEHPTFPTMNVFYRRAIFQANHGFDTSLSVRDPLGRAVEAADADLAWRVIETGHLRRFVPEAIVYHEVEDLGLVGYLLEPTRHFLLPDLVRRHPGLRSVILTARVFVDPMSWLHLLALVIVLLGTIAEPWLLLLLPAMLLGRAVQRTRSLRPDKLLRFCGGLVLHQLRSMVEHLVMVYGSVRFRCLVL